MPRRRREPVWVPRLVVEAIHLDLVRTYGGLPGLRDEDALESALARPRNKWAYGRRVMVPALAAAYAYGLARNHPFRDGNKRIAFMVVAVFLELNGYALVASEEDVVVAMVHLAAGHMSESAMAKWIAAHSEK